MGLIVVGVLAVYVAAIVLLGKLGKSPRQRLLIRLGLLSPVIWTVANGLVGYAWFRVSCAQQAKVTVLQRNLPQASVVRLEGQLSSYHAAYDILVKFPSLIAVEVVQSKSGREARPRPAFSRYERGPLTATSRPDLKFELRETPLDVLGTGPDSLTIVKEGESKAEYVLDAQESEQPLRQEVTVVRLLRADRTEVGRSTRIVYPWMSRSSSVRISDSSTCGRNSRIDVGDEFLRLVAH